MCWINKVLSLYIIVPSVGVHPGLPAYVHVANFLFL